MLLLPDSNTSRCVRGKGSENFGPLRRVLTLPYIFHLNPLAAEDLKERWYIAFEDVK